MDIISSKEDFESFFGEDPLLSLSVRVTRGCNLRCKHCYANAGIKYKDELSKEEILNLVDQTAEKGAFRIFFTGGEPFSRKDIIDLFKYANSKGYATYTSTNGTLITENKLKELAKTDIKLFQVSLDGTKETHERIRGVPGCFDKSINAINLAKKYLPDRQIVIATTLTKENYSDIENLFAFVSKLDVQIFALIMMLVEGKSSKELDVNSIEKKELIDRLVNLKQKLKSKTELSIIVPPALIPNTLKESKFGEGYLCTFPNMLGIDANGDVAPCDGLFDKKELIIGNIKKQKIAELYNHPILKKIRSIGPKDLKGVCSKCKYVEFCMGGCRADAYINYGDFYGPDPICQDLYDAGVFPKSALK